MRHKRGIIELKAASAGIVKTHSWWWLKYAQGGGKEGISQIPRPHGAKRKDGDGGGISHSRRIFGPESKRGVGGRE